MSINKFWFRNVETMDRITVFIDNEFKLCDNFLTIYQLQAFAQSDDSEFITSEHNKGLGFTLDEFTNCDQTRLTTLPEQYELYFTVQPHTKPEVETFVDTASDPNGVYRLYFANDDAWKKLRSEFDSKFFYSIKTIERILFEDKIEVDLRVIDLLSYESKCRLGWYGSELINALDNFEHYHDITTRCAFYISLPNAKEQIKEDASSTEEVTNDKPTRQYILERAIETCCHDRQDQYGEPEDSFRAIAYLWNDYIHLKYDKDAKNGNSIPLVSFCFTPEDVSIMMALMKIARQMYGEGKDDNFVDASAYIAIAGEMWSKGQKK